jgi:hypothetical protein
MKTKLKLFFILISLTGCPVNAQKTNITLKELPKLAQSFLMSNFKGQTVSYIIKDKDIMNTDYETMLSGGTTINFDKKGNWQEIDGNDKVIPNSVLPKGICDYINKNYKSQKVEKIEKETEYYKAGYKVSFLNDLELKFDSNAKFLKIDD